MSNMQRDVPIAVIDYGAGNLRSAARALQHVGAQIVTTSDPDQIRAAPAVVFPGVGATLDSMQALQRLGLIDAIRDVAAAGTPLFGICVGMQVLCSVSDEFGPHPCLDIVDGRVRRLPGGQKVPQIGWNQVCYTPAMRAHPLFIDIPDNSDFYFVHSFYCDLADSQIVAGTTEYGVTFPSALVRENVVAVQFHPEKSGRWGLQLLANFVTWINQISEVGTHESGVELLPPNS